MAQIDQVPKKHKGHSCPGNMSPRQWKTCKDVISASWVF